MWYCFQCAALSVFFPTSLDRDMDYSLKYFPDDAFDYEVIFLPINEDNNHWYLYVLDFVNLSLFYYDSLISICTVDEKRNRRRKIFEALRLLAKEYNKELDWEDWKDVPTKEQEGPFQNNGSDCGVYILQYADRISRNVDTKMSDEQMVIYRKRMIYELLQGELLLPSPY